MIWNFFSCTQKSRHRTRKRTRKIIDGSSDSDNESGEKSNSGVTISNSGSTTLSQKKVFQTFWNESNNQHEEISLRPSLTFFIFNLLYE